MKKYLVGVRIDLVDQILPRVLHSIVVGLMDDDDDVRAVAADTLHPITSAIVKNSPGSLPQILSTLWGTLFLLYFYIYFFFFIYCELIWY